MDDNRENNIINSAPPASSYDINNNSYYNCTNCLSFIEILSINEEDNTIEFKCSNIKDDHSKEKIKMSIEEYLKIIEKNKNINIDKICKIHKKNFIFYCFNCSKHLCKDCIKNNKQHINHDRKIICDIQPNEEDLEIIINKLNYYNNKIKDLKDEKEYEIERETEITDDIPVLIYNKGKENEKLVKIIMRNIKKRRKRNKEK